MCGVGAQCHHGAMVDTITGAQFHEAHGVEDWRVLSWGAQAHFLTGSFAKGAEFVSAVAAVADAAGHHPDIDLRYSTVTVHVWTQSVHELTEKDTALAREISDVARRLQIAADPSRVQRVQIAIDAMDIAKVQPFWRAVLGYDELAEEDIVDPNWVNPNFWFQQMDAPRPQRNRIHIDLYLPRDQAQARVDAALAAGGTVVNDANAPFWWTLADPEGNEVDVAPWPDYYRRGVETDAPA